MRFQAGLQIILLIASGIIVFSVIKPKFEDVKQVQSEVSSYRTALDNIGQYNQRLQTLINQANSISDYDRSLLLRYLPEKVSSTEVSRDISNIVVQNRLLLLDIIPGDETPITVQSDLSVQDQYVYSDDMTLANPTNSSEAAVSSGLVSHQFEVSAVGDYASLKSMLQDLERNAYPLRVVELEFTLDEEGSDLIQYSLLLETYSLTSS